MSYGTDIINGILTDYNQPKSVIEYRINKYLTKFPAEIQTKMLKYQKLQSLMRENILKMDNEAHHVYMKYNVFCLYTFVMVLTKLKSEFVNASMLAHFYPKIEVMQKKWPQFLGYYDNCDSFFLNDLFVLAAEGVVRSIFLQGISELTVRTPNVLDNDQRKKYHAKCYIYFNEMKSLIKNS